MSQIILVVITHIVLVDVVNRDSVEHCSSYLIMKENTNLEYIILHIANFNAGVF